MQNDLVYTLFTFDKSIRSQKPGSYFAFCKEAGSLFDDLKTLGNGVMYYEVHWSSNSLDVPLLFALKGENIHVYTPEGLFERWDHCKVTRGVSIDKQLAKRKERRPFDQQLPVNKCEITWNTKDGLVPGHQVVLETCLDYVNGKASNNTVSLEWEYLRASSYFGPDSNDYVYEQYVVYNNQRYVVHSAELTIAEDISGVHAISWLVPTTLRLENNFDGLLAENDPALIAAYMSTSGSISFALKTSLRLDSALQPKFVIESEDVSEDLARELKMMDMEVPRTLNVIKKVTNFANGTFDTSGVVSGLPLEQRRAMLSRNRKTWEERQKRREADPSYRRLQKEYQVKRAAREQELKDAAEKGDLELWSQLMLSEL